MNNKYYKNAVQEYVDRLLYKLEDNIVYFLSTSGDWTILHAGAALEEQYDLNEAYNIYKYTPAGDTIKKLIIQEKKDAFYKEVLD